MRSMPFRVPSSCGVLVLIANCGGVRAGSSVPISGAAPASSAVSVPSDAAGEKFAQWLAAMNSADGARLAEVHAGAPHAEQIVATDLEAARRTGGFELHHVEEATPTDRVALVRTKREGRWLCLAFSVAPNPPHSIEMIQRAPAGPPAAEKGGAPAPPLDERGRAEVIDALVRELKDEYVFPDKAAAMERELRTRQAKHAYDALGSRLALARALTEDLRAVSQDRHLRVESGCGSSAVEAPAPPPGTASSGPSQPAAPGAHGSIGPPSAGAPPSSAPGGRPPERSQIFGEKRRLDGNVAYLEIPTFAVAIEEVRDEIRDAMNSAADASAIIFDVRSNHGGRPAPIFFISSYLVGNQPVQLSSIYSRPDNKTMDAFTDPHVPGAKFGPDKPVYVLTSKSTFSAGEAFAYDLQAMKRAVIVGETTGGGAHPNSLQPLPHGFRAFVPIARAINPITKTDWEGVGVKPDIEVPSEKALEKAHELARERIRAQAR